MTPLTNLLVESREELNKSGIIATNGDGHYCSHHPDDPAHGDSCYELPEYASEVLDSLIRKAYLLGLERAKEIVSTNQKGTFIDESGNDCWYIDSLEKALDSAIEEVPTPPQQ